LGIVHHFSIMARPKSSTRQSFLAPGVSRFSRSQMETRSGKWASKGKKQVKAPAKTIAKKATKTAKFYPAEDVTRPMPSRHTAQKTASLRSSITPGTVLILLAGRFKGARVVFLKQLTSGLLLVSGS
jgi:large subunit ribosomal protein L6e